ncbi:hypothetical protein ACWCQL_18775 [Streptomyces sp. NPDC002073]
MLGLVLAVGVIGALFTGTDSDKPDGPAVSGTGTGRASEAPAAGPAGDVKITACEVDPATGWASAELLITNRSSKTSTYSVSVEFVDSANKRLGEAFASASRLASGQSAEETAQGLDRIGVKVSCRVTHVTRFAS